MALQKYKNQTLLFTIVKNLILCGRYFAISSCLLILKDHSLKMAWLPDRQKECEWC